MWLRRGRARIGQLAEVLEDGDCGLPEAVVELGSLLLGRIDELDEKIDGLDRKIRTSARENEETARLMTIPGVGPVTALALQAFAPPMESFRRRARLLGLAGPRAPAAHDRRQAEAGQDIEDGPERPETAPGHGSHVGVVRHASRRGEITDPWLAGMLARKPKKVVAVALANRTARRVWALATRKETYQVSHCRLSGRRKERSESGEADGRSGRQDARTE